MTKSQKIDYNKICYKLNEKKIKITKKEMFLDYSDRKSRHVRGLGISTHISIEQKRREFGAHLTSVGVFKEFIFPEIKDVLYKYSWVDLFAGEGNLILPILEYIPKDERIQFFKEHIFLFDIPKEMVEKSIRNAERYGIPYGIAKIIFR
ncbi:MAG: hypothetical protein ACK4Y7_04175 [Caldimicrobium sp.]